MKHPLKRFLDTHGFSAEEFSARINVAVHHVVRTLKGEVRKPYRVWAGMEREGMPTAQLRKEHEDFFRTSEESEGVQSGNSGDD